MPCSCIVDDRLRVVQTNDELGRLFNLHAPPKVLAGEDFQRMAHEWSRIATDPVEFLRQIDRETPAALDLHMIAENYATHKIPRLRSPKGSFRTPGYS